MKKLFVIIVTYNGAKWIRKCLGSVYDSEIEAIPIIIDNNSSDETLRIIRAEYPQTEIVETHANLGFGKTNNIGIKMAMDRGADYIYLLNQDAWVDGNTFSLLIEVMERHPEYGIVSPIHLSGNGQNVDANFYTFSLARDKVPNILNDYIINKLEDIYDTYFVMAAHWMLNRQTIEKIGYFSSAFPHYGEDANYVQRVHYWKQKVGIVPKAFAYHDREFRKDSPKKQVYRKYIIFLTRFHDIYGTSWKTRQLWIVRILVQMIKVGHVPIAYKIKMLTKAYSSIFKARIYRIKYKQSTYPNEQVKEFIEQNCTIFGETEQSHLCKVSKHRR